jgi:hypothetical protein
MTDQKDDEIAAISAFFTSKVKTQYPWLIIVEHEYDYRHDSCYITIKSLNTDINLNFFCSQIQKLTGVSDVFIHTGKNGIGFIIELQSHCRSIFLNQLNPSNASFNKKRGLFVDFIIVILMIIGIWFVIR